MRGLAGLPQLILFAALILVGVAWAIVSAPEASEFPEPVVLDCTDVLA